jgi:hypothetical protein
MRTLASTLVLFLAASFPAACASTPGTCASCATAQAVVESVARQNPDCTRLTIHCAMADGAKACASTAAERIGTASNKEDLDAMATGRTVVLDEAGAIDVTVPINPKNGRFQSACGVTLAAAGMTREQAVAKANAIAKAVETGLGGACECCCK